jgi:putative endonuclease
MTEIEIIRREKRKTTNYRGTNHRVTNHQGGIDAEAIAAAYLEREGYTILARRFKCRAGEIDIIAQNSEVVAFVEVKSRKSALLDDPIGKRGRQRIAGAAVQYISGNPQIADQDMRFDFIFIDSSQPSNHTALEHIKSAWIMEN